MKFSKLSLTASILLGITGLVSCNAVKTESDYDRLKDLHTTTSTAECESVGSFEEPQKSTPIVKTRKRGDKDAPHVDAGCILLGESVDSP